MEDRRLPTTEDVMKKIKDDGDFDALRLKIIRVVKQNEELRKNIIDQVKQSEVLNQDGSEDMKPRQLSDAIYQEIGRKIMGQISDEIWKTIRLNESIKDDIKSTVEQVFSKLAGTEFHTTKASNPSLPHENQIVRREANGLIKTSTATEANILNPNESNEQSVRSKISDLQENELNPQESFSRAKAEDPPLTGLGLSHGGEAEDDSDLPPGFS